MSSPPPARRQPVPLAASTDQALQRLAALSGSSSIDALDGNELLMERAWLTGARFASGRSSSGATRFLDIADGVIAITLARADDWALLPAWLETGDPEFLAVCESGGSDTPEAVEHAWRSLAALARGKTARRLIDQGGAYVNGQRIDAFDHLISDRDFDEDNTIVLRSGKKRFHKIKPQS